MDAFMDGFDVALTIAGFVVGILVVGYGAYLAYTLSEFINDIIVDRYQRHRREQEIRRRARDTTIAEQRADIMGGN